ncbi:hypothetical protein BU197_06905 [Streptomyces sp. CBMA291]|nr:hypothetical protein [Streptomyces sp. CBMA291]MBD0715778.1 hypothetical protein [Streptomyces sp. CBMA370]
MSVSTALALGLLLTSCGSGDPPKAAQKCDNTLSPEAETAAGTLLGTKTFESSGSTLDRAADRVVADWETWQTGRPLGHPSMCELAAKAPLKTGIDIDVRLYEKDDLFNNGSTWWAQGRSLYTMGRETSASNKTAHLYVGCSSPRLKGSEKAPAPLQVYATFDRPLKGTYPQSTPAVREAYVTVVHSVALEIVRKLGCENDAGLPAKPVFTTKKWRGEP